ncbi:MAG: hypothetical protein ABSG68_05870 [Thermoguttaceae bacterium]|jgi:hypothetical protein
MTLFTEAFRRLRADLDQAHQSRAKLLDDLRAHAAEHAAETGRQLAEQARQRHADFAAMMGELRHGVRAGAAQTRRQLHDLNADLRAGRAAFHRSAANR